MRAYHQKGTFQKLVVEDIAATIKNWEARKQNDLRKLAALIKKIISFGKECGGNAVLTYNAERDRLMLSKATREEMLPKDLYSKWDDVYNLGKGIGTQDDSAQEPEIAQTGQKTISTIRTTGDSHKTTIRIGGVNYSIDMSKMPYLESYVRHEKA